MAVGRVLDGPTKHEILILGTADGRIVITTLDLSLLLPIVAVDTSHSFTVAVSSEPPSRHGRSTIRSGHGKGALRPTSGTAVPAAAAAATAAVWAGANTLSGSGAGTGTGASISAHEAADANDIIEANDKMSADTVVENDILMINVSTPAHSRPQGDFGAQNDFINHALKVAAALLHEGALDVSKCRVFSMHSAAVTGVVVSKSGLWVLSVSQDGSQYLYCTTTRISTLMPVPECDTKDCKVSLVDR